MSEEQAPVGVRVHPRGLCESSTVGPGTNVWAFAHILAGAQIGSDCNICDHVFVEGGAVLGDRVTVKNGVLVWDGVTVGDDVFLGPGVVFTNDRQPRSVRGRTSFVPERTLVGAGATLGANATIVCGVTVGAHALVGAGAVVTRDVPAHALVTGSPARQRGWVCACGGALDGRHACRSCGRQTTLLNDSLSQRRASSLI